jgi:hypothetical protein
MAVNSRIMMGVGLAIVVWGGVALAYEQGATGAALIVAGIALFLIGLRQTKAK